MKELARECIINLANSTSDIVEIRNFKYTSSDSWAQANHKLKEINEALESASVKNKQMTNSDRLAQEFHWKQDQLARITNFIEEKKLSLLEDYRASLKSLK